MADNATDAYYPDYSSRRRRELRTIISEETASCHSSDIIRLESISTAASYSEAPSSVGDLSGTQDSIASDMSLGELKRRLRALDSQANLLQSADGSSSSSCSESNCNWIDVSGSSSSSSSDEFAESVDDGSSFQTPRREESTNSARGPSRGRRTTRRSSYKASRGRGSSRTRTPGRSYPRETERQRSFSNNDMPSRSYHGRSSAVHGEGHVRRNSSQGRMAEKRSMRRPNPEGPLLHVKYVPVIDLATTNKDISTVEPLSKQEASPAFLREVPQTIRQDVADGDDVSSIGCYTHSLQPPSPERPFRPRKKKQPSSPQFNLQPNKEETPQTKFEKFLEALDDDEESAVTVRRDRPLSQSGEAIIAEPSKNEIVAGATRKSKKTEMEIFFIFLISFSVIALIILVAIVVGKKK